MRLKGTSPITTKRLARDCALGCAQYRTLSGRRACRRIGPESAETSQGAVHQQGARMSQCFRTSRKVLSRGWGFGIARVLLESGSLVLNLKSLVPHWKLYSAGWLCGSFSNGANLKTVCRSSGESTTICGGPNAIL